MSTTPVLTPYITSRAINVTSTRSLTHLSILTADLAAFLSAGIVAIAGRYEVYGRFEAVSLFSFGLSLSILLLVFSMSGLYPGIALNPIAEFRKILRSASVGFLILTSVTFIIREGVLPSRVVFLSSWLLTLVFVPIYRHLVRDWGSRTDWWGIPTIILGEHQAANMTLDMLQRDPAMGLRPVAVLYDGACPPALEANRPVAGAQVFVGSLSHSSMFARDYRSCYAIVASPLSGSDRLAKLLADHAMQYRRVLVIPDLFGFNSLSVTAKDLCGVLVLEVNPQLTRFLPQMVKRFFDVVMCSTVLCFMSPLLVLLYILVRLSSPGPGLYGQTRIGRGGKEFKVWKFRSMVPNADKVLEEHLEHNPLLRAEWQLNQKLRRDPRVTSIGRVLRKTSLDEIPQLWNVLRGDMSLVGPRPIVAAEVQKYGKSYHRYRQVTPGITGLWQISGRNNTTYETRTRIDDYYVRNWSASLDLYILIRTLKTVLFTEGAY